MADLDFYCPSCGGRITDRNFKACAGEFSCEPLPIVPHTVDVSALADGWLLFCNDCGKGASVQSTHDAEAFAHEHTCERLAVFA